MTIITATRAARAFSEMLDAVERQESFTITRGGRAIAEVRPVRRYTVAGAAQAFDTLPRDPAWAEDVELTRSPDLVWEDPWSS
ncbi:MAG: type II toxin-antitoxin system Phd/YefM family antitoxin [Bifidobacteriaceae bacterium]|jgi:antitoxin (DNA-binding transcriptional repressor) of toxin-antitoxin stability system|nr:type II toxin-antitoxin system Phd/YefM family antitoxin [Bifidobacteriaceae bacterium]